MKEKKAFLFYASNLDVLEQFPEDQARKMAMKIVEYGFSDGHFQCDGKDQLFLKQIFDGIDAEKKRYQDVQLVESYIMKVELLTHKFPEGSADAERQILLALKKLKARVRREHIDNLKDVLFDMVGPEISKAIGNRVYMVSERFDQLLSIASPEDRSAIAQYKENFNEAFNSLVMYEAEYKPSESNR